jgi:hypothetical protein
MAPNAKHSMAKLLRRHVRRSTSVRRQTDGTRSPVLFRFGDSGDSVILVNIVRDSQEHEASSLKLPLNVKNHG